MARQLNIRDDEAYRLAHTIAKETGAPVAKVVVNALREYGSRLPAREDLTPTQRASLDALLALSRESAKRKFPGATSDHGDMYDEFGLPK